MSRNARNIYKLIKENKSLSEICTILNMSAEDFFKILSIMDISKTLKRNYYYSGDIAYNFTKEMPDYIQNGVSIQMPSRKNIFDAYLMSDLHIGSKYERLDLLDYSFNYCVKNDIHIMFVVGDMIEGLSSKNRSKFQNDYYKLFEYFMRVFPYEKNILIVYVLGNHDMYSLMDKNINFAQYLNKYRHDIIVVGNGFGYVRVKRDKIYLCHPLCANYPIPEVDDGIMAIGHYHRPFTYDFSQSNKIYMPSLSDLQFSGSVPSAVRMQGHIKNGYMDDFLFKQIMFGENGQDYTLNSLKLQRTFKSIK